jgi:hypothetical protein
MPTTTSHSRWSRATACAALLLCALAAAPGGPIGPATPAAGQETPDLPCGVKVARTVTPLQIHTDETVHVKITATGGDSGACGGSSRPVDIFFVVDNTETMFDPQLGLIGPTRDALTEFVNQMDLRTSQAGLITYAAEESVKSNLSSDRDRLLQAIRAMRKENENDVRGLASALRTATQKLDNDGTVGNEKMIVTIIAGPDVGNALVNLPTVTQAARNAGVKFAFLLWFEERPGGGRYESRFTHYVEAASECPETDTQCPPWNAGRRWAWPVATSNVPAYTWDESIKATMTMLIGRLLRPISITGIEFQELMNSGADFLQASSSPPPTGGTLRDVRWQFNSIPAGGLTIEYDARMVFTDATYPVTDRTQVNVSYSDGRPGTQGLANPQVTVLGAPTPTVTTNAPTPTRTTVAPTPSPTATRTATASPETPPPLPTTPVATTTRPPIVDTPSPTADPRSRVFVPVTLKGESWR